MTTTCDLETIQPIDKVPPELLSEIFNAVLPPNEDISISLDAGPFLVSHVSRKWRHVALSDSRLWSSFRITITINTKPHHISLINLWIDRSSSQPISLTLWIDPFAHLKPETCKMATAVFRLLAAQSARWRRLSLVMPGSNKLFADLCNSHAPNLQYASFKLGNWTAEEAWDINNLLQRAPAIREFIWSNRSSWGSWDAPFDSGMERLQVSWHNLTNVLLDTWITLKTALDILQQCSSLVKLDLRHFASSPDSELLAHSPGGSASDDKYPSSLPLRLDHLQSLSIYQLKLDDGLAGLLDRLLCPKLQRFNFSCGFVELVKWPQSSFHAFLSRSQASLESLFLEFTGINEEQLIQCMQDSSASLTCLGVYDAYGDICVGDTLLDMLRVKKTAFYRTEKVLCRKLDTLILHRVVECTNGALASTLQSRAPPVSIPSCSHDPESLAQHAKDHSNNSAKNVRACVPFRHASIVFSKRYHATNPTDMSYLQYSCPTQQGAA
ncbi:hypothetical protein BDZ97DRAFT_1335494 [Flammula alnicola]|nr:hypothetical protein BDZ97DRAFT_1335494 [Flammula alnicola]